MLYLQGMNVSPFSSENLYSSAVDDLTGGGGGGEAWQEKD